MGSRMKLGSKECGKCGEEKDLNRFCKDSRRKDNLFIYCRDCQLIYGKSYRERTRDIQRKYSRDYYNKNKELVLAKARASHDPFKKFKQRIKKAYNLTPEDYQQMLENQEYKCFLCKKDEIAKDYRTGKAKRLAVDHCHKTGRIRKLLCTLCNTGIAKFKEDADLLIKAAKYISEF